MHHDQRKLVWLYWFAAGVLATTSAHALGADYRTYVIRPAINNDPILADEALPVQCRDETVM